MSKFFCLPFVDRIIVVCARFEVLTIVTISNVYFWRMFLECHDIFLFQFRHAIHIVQFKRIMTGRRSFVTLVFCFCPVFESNHITCLISPSAPETESPIAGLKRGSEINQIFEHVSSVVLYEHHITSFH
jgi:hypothetical protein